MALMDLGSAPREPLARLLWLSGVQAQVDEELEAAWARAYYDARLEEKMVEAMSLGLHGKRRALGYTRAENERRGRAVRWNDGLDPTSTGYVG